jgi:acetyl-CoA synthetase
MAEEKKSEKTITSMMAEKRVFKPSAEVSKQAYIKSFDEYKKIYDQSIKNPEKFWGDLSTQLDWFKKWDKVVVENFKEAKHEWFVGGKINVAYNCLDRHIKTSKKNKAALIWEGDIGDSKTLTYGELYYHVCKFANVLKKHGVKKGDRVSIYLPMILELPIAMLACARIGAIHSIVFGGFSADALRDRITDCSSTLLITADGYYRGGKVVKSKDTADKAMESCPTIKTCIVVKRANVEVPMTAGRDLWWDAEMNAADIKPVCPPEEMDSEDPLFILYTSGSTGKPKGVLHTQAGYLMYVYQTYKWIFDVKDEDTYWCTADIGWVTGHSYIVYGPLSFGATSVMFEGIPSYPAPDRFWQIIEKYKVNIFYTAPTAIRAIMRDGDDYPNKRDMSSLRILGSVGEPINPEAWMWYYNVIGKTRCPIVDTYWQTETGGIIMTPLPGATPLKPGSATFPFPGVVADVFRENGTKADVNEGGYFVIKRPWPGLMRTVYGDPDRFKKTYFLQFPGVYSTGDGCRVDEDGFFWLMGRIDDVINVSGHRIGTAEVESALVSHPKVAEAAVVGMPHDLKGQGIYAYVTLKTGVAKSDDLKKELIAHVRKEIGPIATPDKIQFAEALPKTRSGKIMRRILTKIASGDVGNLGDTSTLADPAVVEVLVKERL